MSKLSNNYLQWFPKHVQRSLEMITRSLSKIDFVIEVADARMPATSRNQFVREARLRKGIPGILIMNKADLVPSSNHHQLLSYYGDEETVFLCEGKTNALKTLKPILDTVYKSLYITYNEKRIKIRAMAEQERLDRVSGSNRRNSHSLLLDPTRPTPSTPSSPPLLPSLSSLERRQMNSNALADIDTEFPEPKEDLDLEIDDVQADDFGNLKQSYKIDPKKIGALRIMVVGIPNTGKSTVINTIASRESKKGRPTAMGDYAGVTKAPQLIKIRQGPPRIYLLDTPGVVLPVLSENESLYKLAITGGIKLEAVDGLEVLQYLFGKLVENKVNYSVLLDIDCEMPPQGRGAISEETMARLFKDFYINLAEKNAFVVWDKSTGKKRIELARLLDFILKKYRRGLLGKFVLDTFDKTELFNPNVGIKGEQLFILQPMSEAEIRAQSRKPTGVFTFKNVVY